MGDFDLHTVDVRNILGITPGSIKRLRDTGKLTAIKENRTWKYSRKSVYEHKRTQDAQSLNTPIRVKDLTGERLSGMELMFVENFLVCWSAIDAYQQAGFKGQNPYTDSRRLLDTPKIREAIKKRVGKVLLKKQVESESVINELIKIAFSDISNVAEWDNDGGVRIKPSFALSESVTATVQEVSTNNGPHGRNTKVKLYDKQKALDTLAKYLGLVEDNVTNNIQMNWVVEVVEAKDKEILPVGPAEIAYAEDSNPSQA